MSCIPTKDKWHNFEISLCITRGAITEYPSTQGNDDCIHFTVMENKMILNDKTRYETYQELDKEFTAGDRTSPHVNDNCMRQKISGNPDLKQIYFMAFKLPSLIWRVNSNRSLVSHCLPLFDWIQLQHREAAIASFGLVFVAKANGEKVVA